MPHAPRPRQLPRHASPRPRPTRPSASERGYDHDWTKFIARLTSGRAAVCEHCWHYRGVAVPTQLFDHVIPFRGLTDPLRLDEANVRPLCRSCHTRKTQGYDDRIRAYYDKLLGDGVDRERARDITAAKFRYPSDSDRRPVRPNKT